MSPSVSLFNIICITLDTDLKNNYIKSAKRIIEVVAELTGKRPLKHYTNTVSHSDENYVSGQEELQKIAYKNHNIYRIYSGVTMNPPIEELKKFVTDNYPSLEFDRCPFTGHLSGLGFDLIEAKQAIDSRDKTRDNDLGWSNQKGFLLAGGDKKLSKVLYDKYDMMEKLYPHTFSCETVPYHTDDKGELVHCGYCFFCLERWYAFGRII